MHFVISFLERVLDDRSQGHAGVISNLRVRDLQAERRERRVLLDGRSQSSAGIIPDF